MRNIAAMIVFILPLTAGGAELESRVLTHYVPQDLLEKAVRTEGWTEIPLNVPGGVRKGDVVRCWSGGSIDRGNGDQPGQNVGGPEGVSAAATDGPLALAADAAAAYALLFKTDGAGWKKSPGAGKPVEITLTKDKERVFVGFNDRKGRYNDNHLGKGRRHEYDPLWVRVEVVRIITD